MGMYDNVNIHKDVNLNIPEREGFQSKSLECLLHTYELRADGIYKVADFDQGVWEATEAEPEKVNFTGLFECYNWMDNGKWIEVKALMDEGKIIWIKSEIEEKK